MTDDQSQSDEFDAVSEAIMEEHLSDAAKQYAGYIQLMTRVGQGSSAKEGDGVFLSAEECDDLMAVRYNTDHFLAHQAFGKCVDDEGNPMHVIIAPFEHRGQTWGEN